MRRNLTQSFQSVDFLLCFKIWRGRVVPPPASPVPVQLCRHGDSPLSPTSFTAFLASNLLAQFSRQIVIQIFSSESKKVCGNLAVCSLLDFSVFILVKFFFLLRSFKAPTIWYILKLILNHQESRCSENVDIAPQHRSSKNESIQTII
jgi:hypothetical protein